MFDFNLIIIGCGPAGMAAAHTAADCGLTVAILDEQPRPGGQIYRDVTGSGAKRGHILGDDYLEGANLVSDLDHPGITHIPNATVWQVDPGFTCTYSVDGESRSISAPQLIIATGAIERPSPLPGWTLPGVMTAGAAQILLKQSGILPRAAVLVGSGPLLYLIAAQMIRAGSPPIALIETQTSGNYLAALRHLPRALIGWRTLAKGLKLLNEIRNGGVKRYGAATDISITEADGRANGVAFTRRGKAHHIPCETVLLHQGVIPNTQITRSLRVDHKWDAAQKCFAPQRDSLGQTSMNGLYIAGDGAGIGGAWSAAHRGRIAALQVAQAIGKIDETTRAKRTAPIHSALIKEMAPRAFLDALYSPPSEILTPSDTTIICRCEEVTAGMVRRTAEHGPNQTKTATRTGMGPCQGRYCGLTVTNILAEHLNKTPDETGYFRIRAPLKPVTLAEVAGLVGQDKD